MGKKTVLIAVQTILKRKAHRTTENGIDALSVADSFKIISITVEQKESYGMNTYTSGIQ